MSQKKRKYVIIPDDNVYNDTMSTESFSVFKTMHQRLFRKQFNVASQTVDEAASGKSRPPVRAPHSRVMTTDAGQVQLVDSIDLNEATLVKMSPEQAAKFARLYPGLRVKEQQILYPLRFGETSRVLKSSNPASFRSRRSLSLECVDAVSGDPVANAEVVIVLNEVKGSGITGLRTDAQGRLRTALPASLNAIDAIICVPLAGYWGAELLKVAVSQAGATDVKLPLVPLAPDHTDALDLMLRPAKPDDGKGVKIGIVDTGTAPAAGLNIVKGLNTTGTEAGDEWFDNGAGHGTHVAGIVSRIAPSAELYIYRVFTKDAEGADEFAIARAVRQAVEDGCDLINLSLGQSSEPISLTREIRRARAYGAVCVAATGNDGMGPVCYPARSNVVVAVTAAGKLGSWPDGAMNGRSVANKPKPVNGLFFGSFSNIGTEVDFIAPGVGIISWVTATAKGAMDGTSMACPAVVGLIARLLAKKQDLLGKDRDQQRSDDIIRLAAESAQAIGFGYEYEGAGLIT